MTNEIIFDELNRFSQTEWFKFRIESPFGADVALSNYISDWFGLNPLDVLPVVNLWLQKNSF